MTVLRTDGLTLRKPAGSDIPAWTAFFLSDRGAWQGGGPEKTAGQAWRAWAAIIGHWDIHGFGTFVIEDAVTRRQSGHVGPWFPAPWPEREIGWGAWSADVEGTGTMARAAKEVLRHVFVDLGWATTVSYIDRDNNRSIALARRLGAREDPEADRVHPEDLVFRHAAHGADAHPQAGPGKESTDG